MLAIKTPDQRRPPHLSCVGLVPTIQRAAYLHSQRHIPSHRSTLRRTVHAAQTDISWCVVGTSLTERQIVSIAPPPTVPSGLVFEEACPIGTSMCDEAVRASDSRAVMLYLIVFTTGFAGLFHASWWSALVGTCAVALYLLWVDHDEGAAPSLMTAQAASCLVIGTLAGPLAFASGRFAAVVWGV